MTITSPCALTTPHPQGKHFPGTKPFLKKGNTMQTLRINRIHSGFFSFIVEFAGLASFAHGQDTKEIDLTKIELDTDGFCAMDLVDVAEGALLTADAAKKSIDFLNALIARAKAIYLSTTLAYIDGAKKEDLLVQTRNLKSINRNGEKSLGSIIAIHAGGDEDLVTFHFKSSKTKPRLIAAIHVEQSAMGYWQCE